ncbi:hypothetical protein ['Camptotheca acuminata' phytoplasma]|uniref:hypothetical protein n=1 Tax='Camptotheca acuminata' phytoplasma TaxID=3239192 RepID=UPI00351A4796
MGILRALGANSLTISKIFIFEIFIFVIAQTLLVFFMYFLVVFFIFPTFTFDLSPILFQTFKMSEIPNFSSWEKIFVNIDDFTKVGFDEMLDPQKNSEITNISRWLMFPQLSFHPFIRNLLMNLFIFVYIFIISVSFTSFIIYKWSFKKPVDIINDK